MHLKPYVPNISFPVISVSIYIILLTLNGMSPYPAEIVALTVGYISSVLVAFYSKKVPPKNNLRYGLLYAILLTTIVSVLIAVGASYKVPLSSGESSTSPKYCSHA